MANKRIKDLSTTATSLASDDFVAVDGSSQGTRKIQKANLVNDISSEIAGTYLDEANNLSDVSSKDTSKLNLEVPDVGTAPNEVPLNGQLGSMAYQDADSVSMGIVEITDKIDLSGAPTQQLEVSGDAPTVRVTDTSVSVADGESIGKLEFYGNDGSSGGPDVRAKIDTVSETAAGNQYGVAISTSTANSAPVERVRVDGSGRVGIGNSSMSTYNSNANNLVVGSGSGAEGITIATGAASQGGIYFADGTSGGDAYRGHIFYDHNNDSFSLATGATVRWKISSAGHLISNNGLYGIDFGSTTTGSGTPSGGLLDDYEVGTFTPSLQFGGGETGITYSKRSGRYTKIGDMVFVRVSLVLTSKGTSTGSARIAGLPFTSANNDGGVMSTTVYPVNFSSLNGALHVVADKNSGAAVFYDFTGTGRTSVTDANFTNTTTLFFVLTYAA